MSDNYYNVLGVVPGVSETELKEAYRRKALECHPDRATVNNLTVEEATRRFQKVKEAYDNLMEQARTNRPAENFAFSGRPSSDPFKEFEEMLNEYKEGLDETNNLFAETQEEVNKGWDLVREDSIQSTESRLALFGITSQDLSSTLWAPYGDWREKFRNIAGESIATFLNQISNAIDEAGRKKLDNMNNNEKSYSLPTQPQSQWKEEKFDKNWEENIEVKNENIDSQGWNYHCHACGKSETDSYWRSYAGDSAKKFCSDECFRSCSKEQYQKKLEAEKERNQTQKELINANQQTNLNEKGASEMDPIKKKSPNISSSQVSSQVENQKKEIIELKKQVEELQELKNQNKSKVDSRQVNQKTTQLEKQKKELEQRESQFNWWWIVVPVGVFLILGIAFYFKTKKQ